MAFGNKNKVKFRLKLWRLLVGPFGLESDALLNELTRHT